MAIFMVTAVLPALTPAMMELIPSQRARVNQHMFQQRIIAYTLAMDRSRLWIVIQAENDQEADDIMQSLPLTPLIEYSIQETAFHEVIPTRLASISQN